MIRRISLSAMAVSLFASLAAAEVNFDKGGFNIKDEIAKMDAAIPEPSQDKGIFDWLLGRKAPAEWTIMVFGNGKNDLEPFLMKDLNEMELVGSSAKLNIVVEAGRIDGYDTSDGDWKGVRRYLMTKDNDVKKVSSKIVEDLGMIDMGDYKNLAAFGKWAKEKYPAKKYMMIVWNHGSGWSKGGQRPVTKGISYDEQSGNHINTPQLGLALKELGKVDVYGSDACLMQMPEVDYEIKDYADYIVGSEETEPGDGYTYNTFLTPVAANPAMGALELAKVAVNAYSDHYQTLNAGSTQSVVKSASLIRLVTLTNEFTAAMTVSGDKALAKKARDGAMKYAVAENKDFYDFLRLVLAETKSDEVKAKGQALMTFITSELVLHNRTNNDPGGYWNGPINYSLSKGIAVYFPDNGLAAGYSDLQWAKVSRWDEFVTWMNQP